MDNDKQCICQNKKINISKHKNASSLLKTLKKGESSIMRKDDV